MPEDFCKFVFLILLALSPTQCLHIEPSSLTCSNKTIPETNKSGFIKNFFDATNAVKRMILSKGFGYDTEGGNTSTPVYAFGQCFNQLKGKECGVCADKLSLQIFDCAIQSSARAAMLFLDGCFLHYDDHDFRHEVSSPWDHSVCGQEEESSDFSTTIETLLSNLESSAPENGGFAVDEVKKNEISVFGLAQCWAYLNETECKKCLKNGIAKILSCLPKKIGKVLNVGCYMKYSTERFFTNGSPAGSPLGIKLLVIWISTSLIHWSLHDLLRGPINVS